MTRSTTLVIHFVTFLTDCFFSHFCAAFVNAGHELHDVSDVILSVNWTYPIIESKTENPAKYSFDRIFCGNYLL